MQIFRDQIVREVKRDTYHTCTERSVMSISRATRRDIRVQNTESNNDEKIS